MLILMVRDPHQCIQNVSRPPSSGLPQSSLSPCCQCGGNKGTWTPRGELPPPSHTWLPFLLLQGQESIQFTDLWSNTQRMVVNSTVLYIFWSIQYISLYVDVQIERPHTVRPVNHKAIGPNDKCYYTQQPLH